MVIEFEFMRDEGTTVDELEEIAWSSLEARNVPRSYLVDRIGIFNLRRYTGPGVVGEDFSGDCQIRDIGIALLERALASTELSSDDEAHYNGCLECIRQVGFDSVEINYDPKDEEFDILFGLYWESKKRDQGDLNPRPTG